MGTHGNKAKTSSVINCRSIINMQSITNEEFFARSLFISSYVCAKLHVHFAHNLIRQCRPNAHFTATEEPNPLRAGNARRSTHQLAQKPIHVSASSSSVTPIISHKGPLKVSLALSVRHRKASETSGSSHKKSGSNSPRRRTLEKGDSTKPINLRVFTGSGIPLHKENLGCPCPFPSVYPFSLVWSAYA